MQAECKSHPKLRKCDCLQGKAKPSTENIRGLNLVVVRLTTVQVVKMSLKHRVENIKHNLLYTV